jgi:hypothetical protein
MVEVEARSVRNQWNHRILLTLTPLRILQGFKGLLHIAFNTRSLILLDNWSI